MTETPMRGMAMRAASTKETEELSFVFAAGSEQLNRM